MLSAGNVAAFSLALTCCGTMEAAAQTCDGSLSFNFAPMQLGEVSAWNRVNSGLGLSLAYGTDRLFSIGSAEGVWFNSSEDAAFGSTIAIGANQPLRLDNRLHLCPIVTIGYARGTGTTRVLPGAQVSIGWLARNAPDVALIPTMAVRFGDDVANTDSVVRMQIGVGFVIRSRYAVTPRVTLTPATSGHMTAAIGFVYGFKP